MRQTRLVVLAVFSGLGMLASSCGYNVMQQNEEAVFASWADVEAAYQRRLDLIPNLVETVKGYASHEKETLQGVVDARARVGGVSLGKEALNDPAKVAAFQKAHSDLGTALSRLLVVVENYPALKANENFRDLQNQLEGTENRINVARVRYNKAVETFNVSIRVFPNSITNSLLLHLARKEPFKAEEAAKVAPKVKF
ncbi:MAG: LemA family protein [Deltaproteobacteria bacterium]|nr:LemA family protein [Deltaproteobacteria bacterium]